MLSRLLRKSYTAYFLVNLVFNFKTHEKIAQRTWARVPWEGQRQVWLQTWSGTLIGFGQWFRRSKWPEKYKIKTNKAFSSLIYMWMFLSPFYWKKPSCRFTLQNQIHSIIYSNLIYFVSLQVKVTFLEDGYESETWPDFAWFIWISQLSGNIWSLCLFFHCMYPSSSTKIPWLYLI